MTLVPYERQTFGNEILPWVTEDPFEEFIEEYDGLFQFKSNEYEISVHQSIFDKIRYNDRIVLKKNGIEIKGTVTAKKPNLIRKSGIIRIQDANILLNQTMQKYKRVSVDKPNKWPSAAEIIRDISTENKLFQAVDLKFGNCILSSKSIAGTILAKENYKIWDLTLKIYKHNTDNQKRYLKINYYGNYIIEYNRKDNNVSGYWLPDIPGWWEQTDIESHINAEKSSWFSLYNQLYLDSLLPSTYSRSVTNNFYDIENEKFIRISQGKYGNDYKIYIQIIHNYRSVPINNFQIWANQQAFINVLSDICFLTNSYCFVKDFDTLVVRPHNTGYNTVNISNCHNLIIDANQEEENFNYEDYSMKSVSIGGESGNAITLPDNYLGCINEAYKQKYLKTVKTTIKALRKGPGNPFGYIKLHDEVIDNGLKLGVVVSADPSANGKVIEIIIKKHIESEFFTWWRL